MAAALLTVSVGTYLNKYQPFADLIRQSQVNPYANISIAMQDATILRRMSPTETLRLRANQVQLSRDRTTITATGISSSLISAGNGRPLVSFSAGQAVIDAETGIMGNQFRGQVAVSGGAQAQSPDFPHPIVSCDSLTWNSQSNEIVVPGKLTIGLPGYNATATGMGLTYDVGSGNLAVSHVHGAFLIPIEEGAASNAPTAGPRVSPTRS